MYGNAHHIVLHEIFRCPLILFTICVPYYFKNCFQFLGDFHNRFIGPVFQHFNQELLSEFKSILCEKCEPWLLWNLWTIWILWSWIVILTIIIRDMKKLIHHPTSALSLSVNTLLNCCRKPNWLIIKCLFRLANSQYLFITSNYSPVTLSHTFSLCTRLNAAIFKKFSFKALFQHYSYKDLGRSSRPFVQVQWMSTW
jgi:hypothetical protein